MPAVPLMMSLDSMASLPEPRGQATPAPAGRALSISREVALAAVMRPDSRPGCARRLGKDESDARETRVEAGVLNVVESGGQVRRALGCRVQILLVAGRVVEFQRELDDTR